MNAQPSIRVLLVDDHEIVCDVLALLLRKEAGITIAAQTTSGYEAVRLARELKPDVAIVDVAMPDLDGVAATRRIRADLPCMPVVALSQFDSEAYLRQMLHAGASGYVLKKSGVSVLVDAIRSVANGETYLDAALGEGARDVPPSLDGSAGLLTERQEAVLRLVAWGYSGKEVAAQLQLSVKTVESYKAQALEKLELSTRADIVRYALSRGWLSRGQGLH